MVVGRELQNCGPGHVIENSFILLRSKWNLKSIFARCSGILIMNSHTLDKVKNKAGKEVVYCD